MSEPVKILALCGALRAHSYNGMALRTALALMPQGVEAREAVLRDLPLYDGDVEARGFPAPVIALREQMAWAEAFLFVSPEYNHSVSSVLKTAIDWGSRPPNQPFAGKAAAVFGASTGAMGTIRAQTHLRLIGVGLNLTFVAQPEVMIGLAESKFDASGALTDEAAKGLIAKLTVNLRDLALRLRTR